MTREEAIEVLQFTYDDFCRYDNPDDYYAKVLEARKMAIKALQTEPCEDTISRQQALDTFGLSEKSRKYGGDHSGYDTIMLYEVQDALEALPPVQPEQKIGRWIKQTLSIKPFGEDTVLCDQCAFMTDKDNTYNYCPYCGAKMEGRKHE